MGTTNIDGWSSANLASNARGWRNIQRPQILVVLIDHLGEIGAADNGIWGRDAAGPSKPVMEKVDTRSGCRGYLQQITGAVIYPNIGIKNTICNGHSPIAGASIVGYQVRSPERLVMGGMKRDRLRSVQLHRHSSRLRNQAAKGDIKWKRKRSTWKAASKNVGPV